eukprot:15038562-Alexandrium_andersonii.AAC.1
MSAGFFSPGHFEQGEVPGAHAFLHPQLAHCQVPDSPNAGTTAYANGRAAVCAHLQGGRESKVLGDSRQAQPFCRPFDDTG